MSSISVIDLAALFVVAACMLVSMMRGLIVEAVSMASWIVAFLIAKTFAVPFAATAFQSLGSPVAGVVLAFGMLFFAAWLLQKLLRSVLTSVISAVGLGGINRLLGGVLGAVKGIVLVTLAVMVCSFTDLPKTEVWQTAYSIPYFESLAELGLSYFSQKSGGGADI